MDKEMEKIFEEMKDNIERLKKNLLIAQEIIDDCEDSTDEEKE